MGVTEKQRPLGKAETGHRRQIADSLTLADDLADVREMDPKSTFGAAEHGVGGALVHHHRADDGVLRAHRLLGGGRRHAPATEQLVIAGPVLAKAIIGFRVDELEILPRPQP